MIITRAPLRIPLGGGGTDLPGYCSNYGGFILSAAINKYVYINVNKPSIQDVLRVKYSKTEEVFDVAELKHDLVRESLKLLNVNDKLEISAMADVPSGTGMGSSGSFTVALLTALHSYKRVHASLKDLAEEACKIEMDILKHPSGKHDQYLAAFGGITCLEIAKDQSVKVTPIYLSHHDMDELRNNILLFYTGIRRNSCDVLREQSDGAKQSQIVCETYHEIKEIGMMIKNTLEKGNLDDFGKLLHKHWLVKKRTSNKVSNSNIDNLYDVGIKEGALGGKLMGAGGGGFLMFYCSSDGGRKSRLRKAMTAAGLKELLFDFDTDGTKVLMNF